VLESHFTKEQKRILAGCREAEKRFYVPTTLSGLLGRFEYVHTGCLSFQHLTSVLTGLEDVHLTALQANILLSEIDFTQDDQVLPSSPSPPHPFISHATT